MPHFFSTSSRSDRLAWPILLLLLTVLVPSVGVVWMMREAVRNEQLATGQRLSELYQLQLQTASESLQEQWMAQFEGLSEEISQLEPPAAFQHIVRQGFCDSVLIRDDTGQVKYPVSSQPAIDLSLERTADWVVAEQKEYAQGDLAGAATIYERLSQESNNPVFRAYASQARVRCLLKLEDKATAIEVLQGLRSQTDLRDLQGRSMAASAELRLLEVVDRDAELWEEVANSLVQRLGDYSSTSMSSPQRRFLMSAFQELDAERFPLPTQQAEELAAIVLPALEMPVKSGRLMRTEVPEVWLQGSLDREFVALLHTTTIRERLLEMGRDIQLASGVELTVSLKAIPSEFLAEASLGEILADWRVGLKATEGDPLAATSQYRSAVHLWIALVVVAVTGILAWLLGSALRRSWQLANLKNDLVATVSHELKTPLASIRLLVDTLLESEGELTSPKASQKVREYLELISHENARLTRLIDNFLTFSRMERGKQRFDFQVIDIQVVVEQATQVFREHWMDADKCLLVEQGSGMLVMGDVDALVSAVVNLLENAWKYSGEDKQIRLQTETKGDRVEISVTDNGIGLSSRAAAKVFDRFYQVDQRVARSQEGCGLGLSIVRAIMRAHEGDAQVSSQLHVGSTFTLSLPKHVGGTEPSEPDLIESRTA